jgi:hypothetical protein
VKLELRTVNKSRISVEGTPAITPSAMNADRDVKNIEAGTFTR